MIKFDFINCKSILRYLLIISIALIGGFVLKDIIAVIFLILILYFSVVRNLFRAVEVFLIWFFISGFFIGQSLISSAIIINYVAKPSFLLLIVIAFFINKFPRRLFNTKYLEYWFLFLITVLISSLTQGQTPFVVISISSFFLLFILLQATGISVNQYKSYLNLFVAVAVIQTIVSFMQVSELIPAPSRIMQSDSGGEFLWIAGLDDAASGTFGASASHTTSWYAALIALFMFLMYSYTKRKAYLLFMILSFLQFATVDSKIIMGVTLLMFIFTLYLVLKNKSKFKISAKRYIIIFTIIVATGFGIMIAWNAYYNYYGEKTGGGRTSLEVVYDVEVRESFAFVIDNLSEWGKIMGFKYVFEDFVDTNPIRIVWGYGVDGFTSKGKSGDIIRKLSLNMQANSLTNSSSGLINVFAKHGFLGFILFVVSLFYWYRHNNKGKNSIDLIKTSLLKIYLIFSVLVSFLYAIEIAVIPIIAFGGIISILTVLSKKNNILQEQIRMKEYTFAKQTNQF